MLLVHLLGEELLRGLTAESQECTQHEGLLRWAKQRQHPPCAAHEKKALTSLPKHSKCPQGHTLSNKVKVPTQICLTPRCALSLCSDPVGRKWVKGSGRKMIRGCCFRRAKTGLQDRAGDKVKEKRGQAEEGLLVPA